MVTCFWPFAKLFLHNDAIVGLLCSFLQLQVTNVNPWKNGSLLYVVTNHVKTVAFGPQKILPVSQ